MKYLNGKKSLIDTSAGPVLSTILAYQRQSIANIQYILLRSKTRLDAHLLPHTKITTLLSGSNTYETLWPDPTSSYRKKVIDRQQQLQNEEAAGGVILPQTLGKLQLADLQTLLEVVQK